MDLSWMGQVVPLAVPLMTVLAGVLRGQGRLRSSIRHDAETLQQLPENSTVYEYMMSHLESQVKTLREIETEGSRNWLGAMWGLVFAVGFGYLVYWFVTLGSWWYVGAVASALLVFASLYATFDSAVLAKRDERGKRQSSDAQHTHEAN